MERINVGSLLVCAIIFLIVGGQALGSPPANDSYQNPTAIGDVTDLPFNTLNATHDGPGHIITSRNIWYSYTASCTGCVTVSLCGSTYDTMIVAYDNDGYDPNAANTIAQNDDYCDTQSQIRFNVVAGKQYLIEVGGYSHLSGTGVISTSCSTTDCPPTNDYCRDATAVIEVQNLPFDTSNATMDGPGYFMFSPNIWYCYTASDTGHVTIDLCGSNFDTKLAVYQGCSCYPDEEDMIAANDDSGICGVASRVDFNAVIGQQYLIEVGGFASESGQGDLTIVNQKQLCPALNDDCQDALPANDVFDIPFDTTCATFDGPGHCLTSPNLWYCYTATGTGKVRVILHGINFDTKMAIYEGCGCDPEVGDLICCNDDSFDSDARIAFNAVIGNQYLIEIGGKDEQVGVGLLRVRCHAEPPITGVDLGDAPDSTNNSATIMTTYTSAVQANFPSVYNDGTGAGPYGPIHLNPVAVAILGEGITQEIEADSGIDLDVVNNIVPSANAADNDGHDDGVIFPINMPSGEWTTFDYTVKVQTVGTPLWVNVWCDWNRDGDWDDTAATDANMVCEKGFVNEWAVQNQYLFNLPEGLNQITTPAILSWHPTGVPEDIWMRITLSEKPWEGGMHPNEVGNGGSGPAEGYETGETEDYYFLPEDDSEPVCPMCQDLNGDQVINIQDLVQYVSMWLNECM